MYSYLNGTNTFILRCFLSKSQENGYFFGFFTLFFNLLFQFFEGGKKRPVKNVDIHLFLPLFFSCTISKIRYNSSVIFSFYSL